MKSKKHPFNQIIENGRRIIDASREQLKKEFFGIEDVIDQIMDTLSSWYLFPQAQEVPLVICLFGMTGVGKTSLVKRITELLECNDRYFHLDADFYKDKYGRSFSTFYDMFKLHNGQPIILALDEFQHARTKDEMGAEMGESRSSFLWDLLDSNAIYVHDYDYKEGEIASLINELKFFINKGVGVQNGLVTKKVDFWLENMHNIKRGRRRQIHPYELNKDVDVDNLLFINSSRYETILEALPERFNSVCEVKEHVLTLNTRQTIDFLKEVQKALKKPQKIDCSKSLIFLLGNIDEAFHIHNNMSPDISADEFYVQCKNISISHIKNALRRRFRSEHIARLGNNIIIYPSLNCKAYYSILDNELQKTAARIKMLFGVDMTFDDTLKELLYNEGVFPTQGARPLISTIAHHVKSNLSFALIGMAKKADITRVHLSAQHDEIIFSYYAGKSYSHESRRKITLKVENLRQPRMDDMQSIVAVHESGHAVLSGILFRVIPTAVYSQMAGSEQSGLTINKIPWKYLAKREILPRIAMYLGGFAAEKLVFGSDRITTGSESDIEEATSFVCEMLKSSGMGALPACYSVEDFRKNNNIFDTERKNNKEAENLIKEALTLAEKVLKKHEKLLLTLADKLSDNSSLEKKEIKEIFMACVPEIPSESYICENEDLYYRKQLKSKVKNLLQPNNIEKKTESHIFSLNKNKTD